MFNFVLYLWVRGRLDENTIGQLVDHGHLTAAQAGVILDYPRQA